MSERDRDNLLRDIFLINISALAGLKGFWFYEPKNL